MPRLLHSLDIHRYVLLPASAILMLCSCSKQTAANLTKPQPAQAARVSNDDGESAASLRADSTAKFRQLVNYADDLSAVSKRQDVEQLPQSWDGMIALARAEMDGRQWKEARAHLKEAMIMAPNTPSLVMTKSLLATLCAKQGLFDEAVSELNALLASEETASDEQTRRAVEGLKGTIEHYRITGQHLP